MTNLTTKTAQSLSGPSVKDIPQSMKDSHYLIVKKGHPWKGHIGKPTRFESMPFGWAMILKLDNGQSTCVSAMSELQRVSRDG